MHYRHYTNLVQGLEEALKRPLPGAAAHAILEPRAGRAGTRASGAPLRDAAGLVLLYPDGGEPHVVLTLRQAALGRHAGQVSLPGGVVDPGETFEQAALREAHEEIGLNPAGVRLLGRLTPVDIVLTGFRLHPVVAAAAARPALAPASAEVEIILEIALAELADPARLHLTEQRRGDLLVAAPSIRVAGGEIWGATAMALAELLVLAGWRGRRPR